MRADHPIVPGSDNTYYFEVTIENGGDSKWYVGSCLIDMLTWPVSEATLIPHSSSVLGVGLCEESMQLHTMLGMKEGSWGYHGDDGKTFDGSPQAESGYSYGPTFKEGNTIGCGVNFKEDTMFYTKDGEIIGTSVSFLPRRHT